MGESHIYCTGIGPQIVETVRNSQPFGLRNMTRTVDDTVRRKPWDYTGKTEVTPKSG